MRALNMLSVAAGVIVALPAMAQLGPITISGVVLSNSLEQGRFLGAQPGDRVRMVFETLPGGFNPFWGPTGRFVSVNEASFELHVGQGANERICYSAANNSSILFVNAGYVTPAVSQDEMEFFQMALDSSLYRVYFKVSDYDDSVWTSPLVADLPASTPSTPFDFKRWDVTDFNNPNMLPEAPKIVFDFNGAISTPCRGDFNADGFLSVQDIFDFLVSYFQNATAADVNRDQTVSVQDIFDYLVLYFRGC